MKRILFLLVLSILLVSCGTTESNGSENIEKDALELIRIHAKDIYSPIINIGEFREVGTSRETMSRLQILQDFGLIQFSHSNDGTYTSYKVNLTEKGKNLAHKITEIGDKKIYWTVMFEMDDLKIVQVDRKNNIVFFSFIAKPTPLSKNLGRRAPNDGEKFRGKAKLKYDPFLEKNIFLGLQLSRWDHESWVDGEWYYFEDGKKVFKEGFITSE